MNQLASWPVRAIGMAGRYYRGDDVDQNLDHYSVEYTFADGTNLFMNARNISGCHGEFASYAHGTKGRRSSPPTCMHRPSAASTRGTTSSRATFPQSRGAPVTKTKAR